MRQALRHRSNQEALEWARQRMLLPRETWPDEEFQALRNYTADSDPVNFALRGQQPMTPTIQKWVDNIDQAIGRSTLPEPVIVHRGLRDGFKHALGVEPDDEAGMKGLVGRVFREPGYMSTSVGRKAAFDGPYHLMIRVPAGHEGVFIDPYSVFPGEREIILRRNTHYVIHDVYRVGYRWHIEAEVVPDGWTPDPDWTPDPWGDAHEGYQN